MHSPIKLISTFLLLLVNLMVLKSQVTIYPNKGTSLNSYSISQKGNTTATYNGNNLVQTSYTVSGCGINYVQRSNKLFQRPFSLPLGLAQPAIFNIAGIPPCATIVRAFFYAGGSGGGTPINLSITNPLAVNAVFAMA